LGRSICKRVFALEYSHRFSEQNRFAFRTRTVTPQERTQGSNVPRM